MLRMRQVEPVVDVEQSLSYQYLLNVPTTAVIGHVIHLNTQMPVNVLVLMLHDFS